MNTIEYDKSIATLSHLQLIFHISSKVAYVDNCIDSYNRVYKTLMTTVLIGKQDSYLITISAIRPATLYYLLGQYYLIQGVKPCWLPEAMPPIEFPRLILSDFEALLS